MAARRAPVVRRGREAPPPGPGRRLRARRTTTRFTSRGSGRSSRRPRKGNRADVMFVVNGVPGRDRRAQEPEGRRRPRRGRSSSCAATRWRRPSCSAQPQLFNVTHLLDYWYGVTWNANRRDMRASGSRRREETYRFAVQAFFEPHRLPAHAPALDPLLRRGRRDAEVRAARAPARAPSTRSSPAAPTRRRTRGLIWHTQGSGKTFTLLTAARLILEDKDALRERHGDPRRRPHRAGGPAQGVGRPAARRDAAARTSPVRRANSKAELQDISRRRLPRPGHLDDPQVRGDPRRTARPRDNIYVFIDEAHRSVAKDLGTYLMAAVPNATIIGFTGTPVAQTPAGRSGTFKIFGAQDENGLPRQVLDHRVDRGRDDAADQAHAWRRRR